MSIRTYAPTDLPLVLELTLEVFGPFYEQSFRSMVTPKVFEHQHGAWADDYRRQIPTLHNPDNGKYVAVDERDHRLVGYVAWNTDTAHHHGEIDMLAVRDGHRRAGTGRALCEHALDSMRSSNVHVVGVGTGGDPFHAPARHLYESLGFSLIPLAAYLKSID